MKTQFRFRIPFAFSVSIAMGMALAAAPAYAGKAIEDAQQERTKAFNDFFLQYRANKNRDPKTTAAIRKNTLERSNQNTTDAIQQEAYESVKQMGIMVMTEKELDQFRKREQARLASQGPDKSGAGGGAGDKSSGGGGRGGKGGPESSIKFGGAPSESGVTKAEEKIDGSKIPSKIQFGKKKPAKVEDDD